MTDDYSVDNAQMQSTTDPGEVGTESKPTTLAGELERIRFAVKELKQWCAGTIAQWYESPTAQVVLSEDARTNTVATGLTVRRTTTGTPAASIGTRVLIQGESADENPADFVALDAIATDVGAGTEDTVLDILLRVAGAALSAAFRFTTTVAFRAIFSHANTADRTYTLPNVTGTLALTAGASHGDNAAVHGLPASVNVLGNRSAAGEFVQRADVNPGAVGSTALSVYGSGVSTITITFAVAYSGVVHVWWSGTEGTTEDSWGGATNITTTAFNLVVWSTVAGRDLAGGKWVSLGG